MEALDHRHHLNTADLAAHIAVALAPLIEARVREARSGTVTPPPCDNHRETQHRDKRPPWCETCGWNHGRPAIQPFQVT